ncbi:hypothetical protein AB0O68_30980 [Streptomyces sp. NPDC087512]|uniref:ornithine cyclodeaminase family protein n=1 Tax=Streptomyces sp. NPDC087512 TaxID=3155059 RepID=UPI00341D62B6
MPHHDPGRSITIKTVAYTPSNPSTYQLPTIIGSLTRYDDVTGSLLAVCDGILPTSIRTGAASAIASRLLARPDSRVLGLVDAGTQAATQAHVFSRVFPLEQILVYDIEPAHAASFSDRVDLLDLDIRVVELAELETAADIICTVTSGADLIGKFEVPVPVLKSALVTPDHRAQALREGECQQLDEADLGPDLMALCADPETASRYRDSVRSSTRRASGRRTTWPSTCCSNSPRKPASATGSRSHTCRAAGRTPAPGISCVRTPGTGVRPGCGGCSQWCARVRACRRSC